MLRDRQIVLPSIARAAGGIILQCLMYTSAWSAPRRAARRITGRRELIKLGHEVRRMPPAYVKPYVKRGKTDAGDGEAEKSSKRRSGGTTHQRGPQRCLWVACYARCQPGPFDKPPMAWVRAGAKVRASPRLVFLCKTLYGKVDFSKTKKERPPGNGKNAYRHSAATGIS
jgi:hypothetical protein